MSIAISFLALAVVAFSDLRSSFLGLNPAEIAGLCVYGALIALLIGDVIGRIRRPSPWIKNAATGVLIALVPVVLYLRRNDFVIYLDKYIGDIQPGRVVVNQNGEVITAKPTSEGFMLLGSIEGHSARFIFDTGATTVVLMSETAESLGIRTSKLDYSKPVFTANGATLAAEYMIKSITFGSITERNVPALIAQKDALRENLLGMTFLDRLASYEVRGNRLILRGKKKS